MSAGGGAGACVCPGNLHGTCAPTPPTIDAIAATLQQFIIGNNLEILNNGVVNEHCLTKLITNVQFFNSFLYFFVEKSFILNISSHFLVLGHIECLKNRL